MQNMNTVVSTYYGPVVGQENNLMRTLLKLLFLWSK